MRPDGSGAFGMKISSELILSLAFTIYWLQKENITNQYFFSEKVKKSKNVQSHLLLLSFYFDFMRPQTF